MVQKLFRIRTSTQIICHHQFIWWGTQLGVMTEWRKGRVPFPKWPVHTTVCGLVHKTHSPLRSQFIECVKWDERLSASYAQGCNSSRMLLPPAASRGRYAEGLQTDVRAACRNQLYSGVGKLESSNSYVTICLGVNTCQICPGWGLFPDKVPLDV